MSKSALRTIRDIVVIIAAIGIAITLYVRLKTPDTNLKHDIQVNQDTSAHNMADMHMGSGTDLLPEGNDSVVATAAGKEVTQKELNSEANKLFRRLPVKPDEETAKSEEFQYGVKSKGLGVIFSNALMLNAIKDAGLDIEKAVDRKLADWASDFGSPEEKLKSIQGPTGVTVDRMRGLFRDEVIPELTIQALTGKEGDVSDNEQTKALDDWLVDNLLLLEPKFEDPKLAEYWGKYLEILKNPPPADASADMGSMPQDMAHGMPEQAPDEEG